jgi:hypothetical protein
MMGKCLIWGTPAEEMPRLGQSVHLNSPRADGQYKITSTVLDRIESLAAKDKKRLTTWLVVQHRAGIVVPEIKSSNLEDILRRPLMSFSERVDRAILFFGTRTDVGGVIAINDVSGASRELLYPFLAFTESAEAGEAQSLLKLMCEMGLLSRPMPNHDTTFFVMPNGWLRFDELQSKAVRSSQAFVAMWFNSTTDEPYENGLYKAIYDAGYDPVRVDQQRHHMNKVDDEVVAEIRRSRFLVADFTCEPEKVRGGVYFEAGFAMGLNIPIIWTCKNASLKDLHFDTRQYPHIPWKDSADLYRQLKARIGALIGDGPKQRIEVHRS